MTARPFWVIFTICVIILAEWLAVKPIVEWLMVDEIAAMNLSYNEVLRSGQSTGNPEADKRLVVREDLADKSFQFKWETFYTHNQNKAVLIATSLALVGILAGFLFASVAFRHLVSVGDRLSQMSMMDKAAIFLGLLIGLMLSVILVPGVMSLLRLPRSPIATAVAGVLIMYACMMAIMSMKDELKFYYPGLTRTGQLDKAFQKPKILDTNVIIDGRVADVCRTGFIEGQVYIPSFVLEELQHIADSPDALRRARGRRGLDILNAMRKELDLVVIQAGAVDPADSDEVDARLVKLAKEVDGCIVTNDFNLNKVAELQGVTVLNINELANALKPVLLPGEELTVSIIKEGKEAIQGVAYLDDGTMVVVEGGKSYIGQTVDAVVTSVLQTVAGKMIFANLKSAQEEEDDLIGRNVRNYSGLRSRKKTG
ncbi:MAG: PIN domain-containing protein [Armatimonadetes bacterium]|nr:PIN domain-containing protein [Armatimonadota bacterium]